MFKPIIALSLLLASTAVATAGTVQQDWVGRKKTQAITVGSSTVNLKYVEMGPPAGKTIILLHGYTDTSRSWSLVADLLKDRFRLLILDLRGHGGSFKPLAASNVTISAMANDVGAFMRAKGVARAPIVCHSMGCAVTLQMALSSTLKPLVERMVLIGASAYGTNNATFAWVKEQLALQTWRQPPQTPLDPNSQFLEDWTATVKPAPTDFIAYVRQEAAATPKVTWDGALASLVTYDFRARLYQITAPSVTIYGDQDGVFPPETQDSLRKMPGAQLPKVRAGVGHNVQWEDWVWTAGAIRASIP